jgi:hypothetical protein
MGGVQDQRRAIIVLNPSESKRLIARAVAHIAEVKQALKQGRLIIGNGTTNAFIAEELLGQPVAKWCYAAGVIAGGRLDVTEQDTRLPPIALKHGKPFQSGWLELLREFERGDVFIKGGNAVDPEGNVGVLLGSDTGGTVGQMFGTVAARGAFLIAPVGLEKLIPDVLEAARHCGTSSTDIADGIPVGMAVLPNAHLVTELEAFEILFGVEAWHIASGGVSGSEGAVTVAVEGAAAAVKDAFDLAEFIAGERPVTRA